MAKLHAKGAIAPRCSSMSSQLRKPPEQLIAAARTGDVQTISTLLTNKRKALRKHYINYAMCEAATRGHVRAVEILLDQGNADFAGTFFLRDVVGQGMTEVLELFIEWGWDITTEQAPLLTYALEDRDMMHWLLAKRVDVNALNLVTGEECPLTTASSKASVETVQFLLQHGAEQREGRALHAAMTRNDTVWRSMAELLLSRGADVNAFWIDRHLTGRENLAPKTPLMSVVEHQGLAKPEGLERLQYLLGRRADPNLASPGHPNAIQASLSRGQIEYAEFMAEWVATDGRVVWKEGNGGTISIIRQG